MTNWLELFPKEKPTRNRVEFLRDGAEYFKSVMEAIETAGTKDKDTDYVYILGWMLDIKLQLVENDAQKTLFNVLKKADERGVEIRILIADNNPLSKYAELGRGAIQLLDPLPNTKAFLDRYTFFPKTLNKDLRGILVLVRELLVNYYNELKVFSNSVDSFLKYLNDLLKGSRNLGDHHEKVVIVKGPSGLIAYCGGIDFNKNRVLSTIQGKPNPFPEMHDTACRLEGPAAYEVLQKFKRRWHNHPKASKEKLLRGENETPKEAAASNHYAKVVGTYTNPDGSNPDRSLRKVYLDIIKNAKTFIYIEDPYLVNLDVAKALNKKIKERNFQKVFFAIQDLKESDDILIPNRKRKEFYLAVIDAATTKQQEELQKKVLVSMIDLRFWDTMYYHPGMHAKTLIVDDEIAIIGSANLTQRSFTIESETCVVVFDEQGKLTDVFARDFRIKTWKEFAWRVFKQSLFNAAYYEAPLIYPKAIESGSFEPPYADGVPIQYFPKGFSMLKKYQDNTKRDLDDKINDTILVASLGAAAVGEEDLASKVLPPRDLVKQVFDFLWKELIDPKAD